VIEKPRRILLITFDVIGPRIGGSAIRVLGLARALATKGYAPTIAAPRVEAGHPEQPFSIRKFELAQPREMLAALLENADLAVLPLQGLARLPFLGKARIPLVFDIYDPVLFELMETAPGEMRGHVQLLNRLFRRGDFFICASERQRAFWLDALVANRRINSSVTEDPELRALIDVVPFGIDPTLPPSPTNDRSFLNAAVPSLGREKVIVWPGGMWDWTDPQIVLRAMQILGRKAAGIRILFFAGTHPTEGHFESSALKEARALANEFQLTGHSVHFIDDYVPYAERGRYLVECDAAVSTHRANLESHYAYRTRLLDCIWAGLPIVCTEGDVLADTVARNGFGVVVPPRDAAALAAAIERISTDGNFAASCRARIAACRHLFDWNDAIEPLARFCDQPRVTHVAASGRNAGLLAESAWRVFKTRGAQETFRRLRQHLRSR